MQQMPPESMEYWTPKPRYAQPVYAQPVYAQPRYAQPRYAQPNKRYAQPVYAQPGKKYAHSKIIIIDHSKLAEDARCCGLCYLFSCSNKPNCNCCPANINMYCLSPYIQTNNGYNGDKNDWCCTCFCFPVKFTLFFPCFLGAIANDCTNELCNTMNLNYLF